MIKKNMRTVVCLFCSSLVLCLNAQITADFENYELGEESYLNGSNGDNGFRSANVFLDNDYDFNYDFWAGWSISNTTDNMTPGFSNQYSAIAGQGAEGSSNYAVTYAFDPVNIILENDAVGEPVESIYVTNSSYSYYSIRDGDSFAKKFGGASGGDPDYFLLTIKKYLEGELSVDSIDFYLADYRFDDNAEDYIIDEWFLINLESLGAADSLQLRLRSSDSGIFGMNTPAYICVDQITTAGMLSSTIQETGFSKIMIYPNPSSDVIYIDNIESFTDLRLVDYSSKTVIKNIDRSPVDLFNLAPGLYYLLGYSENQSLHQLVIKH